MAVLPSILRPPEDRRRHNALSTIITTTRALTHLRQAHLTSRNLIATAAAPKRPITQTLLTNLAAAAAGPAHDVDDDDDDDDNDVGNDDDNDVGNDERKQKHAAQAIVTNTRRPTPSGLPVARDFQTPSPPPGRSDEGGVVWNPPTPMMPGKPRKPPRTRGVARARIWRGRWRWTEEGSPVGVGDDEVEEGGLIGEGEGVVERFLLGQRVVVVKTARRRLEGEFRALVGGWEARKWGWGYDGAVDARDDGEEERTEEASTGSGTSDSSEIMRDPWDWESLVDAALEAVMSSPVQRAALSETKTIRKRYVSENWVAYSPLASVSEDGENSDGNGRTALQSRSTLDVHAPESYDSDAISEEEEDIFGVKNSKDRMPWRRKVNGKTVSQSPEANGNDLDTFASTPATLIRRNRFEGPSASSLRSISDWPITPKKPNKYFRMTAPDANANGSPDFQTMRAGELPLFQGFEVNLCNEDMEDPFVDPVQGDPGPSVDEIDGLLTKVWDAYNDGNPRSREVLLMRLREALVEQERLV